MKNAHLVELLLGCALLALLALLLTLARWRPAAVNPKTPSAPQPPAAAPWPLAQLAEQAQASLEPLTVAQLRAQTRAAGLPRALARSGRRAQLLEALAGLEAAMV
jgi:hypothetical protein